MTFEEYYNDEDYIVEDLNVVRDDLEYLFVLESPHNEELKIENRYPAAGDTGKDMVSYLFREQFGKQTLGKLVKNGGNERCKKIGIMNVSRVPLQETEKLTNDIKYKDQTVVVDIFNILNKIRTANTGFGKFIGKTGVISNVYEKKIYDNFVERIKDIKNKEKINVVLCGRFAQKHYIQYVSSVSDKQEFIAFKEKFYVPHPARHNWTGQFDQLQELKGVINSWNNGQ